MEELVNILVVDDHPANRTALEAVLAPLGQRLVLAGSGDEALKQLLDLEFAVVLLDVVMPGVTGFDVAKLMRQRDKTRNVPIIFLTAREVERNQVLKGYLHGAVDYIVKPFDAEVLRAKVSVFVELDRARELARRLSREEASRMHAEAAVRSRDEFIAVASHELRTPLTTLKLQADSLRRALTRGEATAERLLGPVDVIRKQLGRLERLIDDLLDVSRITAGKLPLVIEEIDLSGVARDVVQRFAEELSQAGCRMTLEANRPLVGHWDKLRVDQVITNLLTNAMKYGKGKPIEVRVEEVEGRARAVVRDHGIGIAPENQARIFDRFERATSEKNFGGLGLGLWIVARVVEALGGRISVESELGAGATFTVDLPK